MKIRAYGDTLNDGKIQISFTLPIPASDKGIKAAEIYAKQMGVLDPSVVHMESVGDEFSFYIVYGAVPYDVDLKTIVVEKPTVLSMEKEEIEALIAEHFDRDIVFIGASTGTDAHTVGIDAIMNMKGFAGHYGLERYQGIKAINLGSQVLNEDFIKQAKLYRADVLLVSQTVTQKDVHIKNMVELVEMLEAEGMREHILLIAGGARITHELAKELGYDAGFGPKKYAEDVASFAILEMIKRKKKNN